MKTVKCVLGFLLLMVVLVGQVPNIPHMPAGVAYVGQTVTIKVVATGSAPLSYRWVKNNAVIQGANKANLVLPNVNQSTSGTYTVTVSNPKGSAHGSFYLQVRHH